MPHIVIGMAQNLQQCLPQRTKIGLSNIWNILLCEIRIGLIEKYSQTIDASIVDGRWE